MNGRVRLRLALLIFLLGLFAALLFIGQSQAEQVKDLKPTGYVDDFAHVLNASTTAQITNICTQIDQKAHAQIALVTINTLDGADLESYSIDLAQKWGMGGKGKDRGVLILYVIQDRRARVEVGYGLEPILPDGKVGGFQREAIPLMRSGDYNHALLLVTTRIAQVIADDASIQLTNAQPPVVRQRPEPEGGISLGGIIVFIVVILIILATPLRSLLFAILFSNIFGGGGGWGGGGFGGFGGGGGGSWGGGGGSGGGGGGGFGGFGGGSFGGGGASSSW